MVGISYNSTKPLTWIKECVANKNQIDICKIKVIHIITMWTDISFQPSFNTSLTFN